MAVVPGGATYAEVAPVLQDHGLALHNLASLPHISVAGACATGTHGSGPGLGSLATAVCAVELVTASGEVVRIDEGDAGFGGAVLSLGALGVVTRLWLRTEPTYDVRQTVWVDLPADEVAAQLAEVMASGTSVSVFTDFADPARISSVWVKDRVDRPSTLAPCLAAHRPADHEVHPVPGVDPAAATPQQGAVGPWHERLPHFRASHVPSVGDELQSEVFLPRAAAAHLLPTLTAITDVVAPALMVHEIRAVAADDLWLSPLRGRDSVVAHFTWKPDVARAMVAIRAVEDALARWEPRVHWGKLTATEELRAPDGVYDLAAFHDLCARLDPGGDVPQRPGAGSGPGHLLEGRDRRIAVRAARGARRPRARHRSRHRVVRERGPRGVADLVGRWRSRRRGSSRRRARAARSALCGWSAPSGSSTDGSPCASAAIRLPEPPWLTTRSASGSTSACGTNRSTRTCAGCGPRAAGSSSRPIVTTHVGVEPAEARRRAARRGRRRSC